MIFGKVQKRRGIGTVITTLIVLIASVVLGAGVIFFGGSLFQTNAQSESIKVTNSHVWVSNNNTSVAAFAVQNTGGKPVSLNAISIRGLSVPTASWYYNTNSADASAANIQREFVHDFVPSDGVNVDGLAGAEGFTQAAGPISMNQGEAKIIYLLDPANIDAIDAGNNMTFSIQAGQASAVQSVAVVNAN
jgi:hypothetical protein